MSGIIVSYFKSRCSQEALQSDKVSLLNRLVSVLKPQKWVSSSKIFHQKRTTRLPHARVTSSQYLNLLDAFVLLFSTLHSLHQRVTATEGLDYLCLSRVCARSRSMLVLRAGVSRARSRRALGRRRWSSPCSDLDLWVMGRSRSHCRMRLLLEKVGLVARVWGRMIEKVVLGLGNLLLRGLKALIVVCDVGAWV